MEKFAKTKAPLMNSANLLNCPACKQPLLSNVQRYCHLCGHYLPRNLLASEPNLQTSSLNTEMEAVAVRFVLGSYQVQKMIGKGGMGEVFLAYDSLYNRRLAIKRIRPDLMGNKAIFNRFIKEARITVQLTHPAIIPIYSIHDTNELAYYTMPYIEGETLKQVLIRTKKKQKIGQKLDHIGTSIPALVRIFLSVCQAVAYAHSKQVLHRDLKPENVILGKFGEVFILDWGLAQMITHVEEEAAPNDDFTKQNFTQTSVGKVVGTIAYMAPERAHGEPANFKTDIYSLGVILYQILTLHMPFKRKNLKDLRQKANKEKYIEPALIAPYRDIPPLLSHIAAKCLALQPKERYQNINELVHDLENYLEGRSEWIQVAQLEIKNKKDWEFQEHVFFGEHMAITRHPESPDWVNLMVSKASFTGNTMLQAKIRLGDRCHGIGFMLNIPEPLERTQLNEGYCLWLSSDRFRSTRLLRSAVEVMRLPDLVLERNIWHTLRLEKKDNNIYFYLNELLQFSYIGYMPLRGTHIGVISRDADFILSDFTVFVASLNLTVSCLAVPDAFLSHKNYNSALSEYRRIAYSFPGRAEGREALFRAGVTLLEKARSSHRFEEKQELLEESLQEFSKLHATPGAPLEYAGKALVYQVMRDFKEEGKCFELGLRRYSHHPLQSILSDHLIFRMHEAARSHRKAAYNFILLAIRHVPHITEIMPSYKLFNNLFNHWEKLPFIELLHTYSDLNFGKAPLASFAATLAFWLKKPYVLEELLKDLVQQSDKIEDLSKAITDILFASLELEEYELVENALSQEKISSLVEHDFKYCLEIIKKPFKEALQPFLLGDKSAIITFTMWRIYYFFIEMAIDLEERELALELLNSLEIQDKEKKYKKEIACWRLWIYLYQNKIEAATAILGEFELEELTHEDTILFFLYGCYLEYTEGHAIALVHFAGALDNPYPRSWMLSSHYIIGKLDERRGWPIKAFYWEKKQLWRQLALFYHCCGDEAQTAFWKEHIKKNRTRNYT